jgi:serine/threonine protein kinase
MICAIKIMAKREIRENNMLEQLVREMKIQLYVNHPNIVKFYGFFDDLLHCYILMECALDGHLSEYLKKTPNPLSEVEAANYLNQLCSAVALLHSSRIIHRDLKP